MKRNWMWSVQRFTKTAHPCFLTLQRQKEGWFPKRVRNT